MKAKLIILLAYIFVLINVSYCQLLSNFDNKAEWAYFSKLEHLPHTTFSPTPTPNPPPCSTQYIALENPFRGFNEADGSDIGFVARYASDNITANNICEYYSSIETVKSTNDPNHNIGFENGDLTGWIKINGLNRDSPYVYNYKCGQLSFWGKGLSLDRASVINTIPITYDQYATNSLTLRPPGMENNRHFLKLGNDEFEQKGNIIFRKIRIYKVNPNLKYSYALVMGNFPHNYCHAPYFRAILLNKNCQIIECASQTVNVIKNGQRLISTDVMSHNFVTVENPSLAYNISSNPTLSPAYGKVAPWASMVINTANYFVDNNAEYEDFTIAFITSACAGNRDMSYAYIDLEVGVNPIFTNDSKNCNRKFLKFYGPTDNFDGESYSWNFGDQSPTSTEKNPMHKYLEPGNYNVSLTVTVTPPVINSSELPAPLCCSTFTYNTTIQIIGCGGYESSCQDCMNTFKPQEGKNYIVSAWVKQDKANINSSTNKLSFDQATIQLVFKNQANSAIGSPLNLNASGEIIDGWQRMEHNILIPTGAHSVDISLKNTSTLEGNNAYYDDIRIFPTDGSLKSYVYDPNTLKLVAELDENNYSTFYEYDEGGVLVRVKKETERGIITIKESGENKSKSE